MTLMKFIISKYQGTSDEEPKDAGPVWINPQYIVSINPLPQDKFNRHRACITVTSHDGESSHEWLVLAWAEDLALEIYNAQSK